MFTEGKWYTRTYAKLRIRVIYDVNDLE